MTPETTMAIESILMVADQPVEATVLAQLLEVPKAEIEAACAELAEGYAAAGRGFILARVAGGYRFQSHPESAQYVERFVLDGQSSRLSNAALETLAIVAYKQPISRMQVAAIRGVAVDGVLRTLQQRGYIDEVSRDPGPGNAVLFGTTSLFLERVGLNALEDLPPLAAFVPGADVVEALEEGLRPEPISIVAEEAAQMAEVVGDEEPASEELVSEEPVSEELVSEEPVSEELVSEEPVSEELVSEDADPVVTPPVIDLTEVEVPSGGPTVAEPRSITVEPDLASPSASTSTISSTIRHEPPGIVPESVDEPPGPAESFRSAPGAGTGGPDLDVEAGVGMGEEDGPTTRSSDSPLTDPSR